MSGFRDKRKSSGLKFLFLEKYEENTYRSENSMYEGLHMSSSAHGRVETKHDDPYLRPKIRILALNPISALSIG
jgi:hypothetical protein